MAAILARLMKVSAADLALGKPSERNALVRATCARLCKLGRRVMIAVAIRKAFGFARGTLFGWTRRKRLGIFDARRGQAIRHGDTSGKTEPWTRFTRCALQHSVHSPESLPPQSKQNNRLHFAHLSWGKHDAHVNSRLQFEHDARRRTLWPPQDDVIGALC
jgi:hypothetical protein